MKAFEQSVLGMAATGCQKSSEIPCIESAMPPAEWCPPCWAKTLRTKLEEGVDTRQTYASDRVYYVKLGASDIRDVEMRKVRARSKAAAKRAFEGHRHGVLKVYTAMECRRIEPDWWSLLKKNKPDTVKPV